MFYIGITAIKVYVLINMKFIISHKKHSAFPSFIILNFSLNMKATNDII